MTNQRLLISEDDAEFAATEKAKAKDLYLKIGHFLGFLDN